MIIPQIRGEETIKLELQVFYKDQYNQVLLQQLCIILVENIMVH